jgi:phosphomannomutase
MEELRPLFWKNFSSYYRNCMSYLKDKSVKSRCIDCANGVGGKIMPYFQEELKDLLDIELINNTTS